MAVLAWMGLNLVVDALLGLVPGVGDLLDVAHRANRKNLRLLLREIERQPLREPPSAAYVVGAVALMVVPVLAGLVVDGARDLAPLALADLIPDPDFTCRSGVG